MAIGSRTAPRAKNLVKMAPRCRAAPGWRGLPRYCPDLKRGFARLPVAASCRQLDATPTPRENRAATAGGHVCWSNPASAHETHRLHRPVCRGRGVGGGRDSAERRLAVGRAQRDRSERRLAGVPARDDRTQLGTRRDGRRRLARPGNRYRQPSDSDQLPRHARDEHPGRVRRRVSHGLPLRTRLRVLPGRRRQLRPGSPLRRRRARRRACAARPPRRRTASQLRVSHRHALPDQRHTFVSTSRCAGGRLPDVRLRAESSPADSQCHNPRQRPCCRRCDDDRRSRSRPVRPADLQPAGPSGVVRKSSRRCERAEPERSGIRRSARPDLVEGQGARARLRPGGRRHHRPQLPDRRDRASGQRL